MKKKSLVFIFVFVGIFVFPLSSLKAQCICIPWNTFLGSSSEDRGWSIVSDSFGNVYLTGYSDASWGSPINPHAGGQDVFVTKLDTNGNLLWNTFLGSGSNDWGGRGIALDSSGNILVIGYSWASWGNPINPYVGDRDVFVAKLDTNGDLLWNTFYGSESSDRGIGISSDITGIIHITGYSDATWGSPINTHAGDDDAFVAKLDTNGNLLWNTFLGSASWETTWTITSDSSGNIYIAGESSGNWGSPINPYNGGGADAFVAKLDTNGNLLWNTFLGSNYWDFGIGIALDSSGNIYVSGDSDSWGSPINPHSGGQDAFVAKLDSNGNLLWNTFLGAQGWDVGNEIFLDIIGNIYVTGSSSSSWGSPINPHAGGLDGHVAKLDTNGNLLWNTFLGSGSEERSFSIVLDSVGNIYVTGWSYATWGNPINPFAGDVDAFVAKIAQPPVPDIKANGSDGPISIAKSDTLQVTVALDANCETTKADWWVSANTPFGWYSYNAKTESWKPGLNVTHQGFLFDFGPKEVLNISGLKPGTYLFFFGVDMNMDGNLTKSCLYYNKVKVTVTSE